ncbi:DUF1553 domain-containing protein [Pleomorphovibrio marinus]|uniref:DUF1553 domain-containing protein n=1 Tax=Pleomorphovibrio marinus TaxID=2164132 RepID=UPI000E0ACA47|nr:DUF1553 domain-containing protein [Pleomorphovibrio marinus]
MIKKFPYIFASSLLFLSGIILWQLGHEEKVDFSADVKPILNKHCISCHGGVKKNGGLSFLFEEEAKSATESGVPAILPGNAKKSEMIKRLHEKDPELRMPYDRPPLSEKEIETLSKWIDQGAEWGSHWAYSPVMAPENNSKKLEASFGNKEEGDFVKNGIDSFIMDRLAELNLTPSPEADPATLARRLSLDLTGLPLSQDLRKDYLNGKISYSDLVDTLLDQETYGEKWASWWLDLARYADTKGYERDVSRKIWAYRDWVIKAFNQDMPFDQFTVEQLAGDLLPNPSLDQLTATAFHRNTMNNDEGGTEDEEFRVAAVMDRTNTTFEVWQSTTIACVQCHSHPYDPFKHDEYFQLMAFFNNTRDEDTHGEEPKLKFYEEEEAKKVASIKEWAEKNASGADAQYFEDFLLYQEPKYHAHNCEDFDKGELIDTKWLGLWHDGSCYLRNALTGGAPFIYLNYWTGNDGNRLTIRKDGPDGEILSQFTLNKTDGRVIKKFPFKPVKGRVDLYLHMENPSLKPEQTSSAINWMAFVPALPGEGPQQKALSETFDELLNTATSTVPILIENPDFMKRETHVFERGNWLLHGDRVGPNTPSSLGAWKEEWPQNRLGLAYWLTDKENPLTARTVVNRIWSQLFGRGLVSTIEDMGTQSDPPSHQELLDWLAWRLMNEHNWQLKGLIKDIVISSTYRQSSKSNPHLHEVDPENKFYARGPRFRISAEQVRDQALAVSGLLSKKMYGPSVMPPQPKGVWQTVYNGENWETSEGEDRYRRAIYTFLKRTSPYPSFMTFDAASREVCLVNRTVTNTPLQALVTLNDPVYLETAYYLAKQANTHKGTFRDKLAIAYEHSLGKKPSSSQLDHLEGLFHIALEDFKEDPEAMEDFLVFAEESSEKTAELAAMTVVANAIMNLDEFLTKS